MNTPKIFIVLVNYNGYKDTIECIQSLKMITYSNYEIIVVDNCSTEKITDEEKKYLKKASILLETKENLGFSGGNNIGIHYALKHGADYVLLLNNDTIVTADFLDILLSEYEKHEDAGCVIGRIHYYDEPEKTWYAGGNINFDDASAVHDPWEIEYETVALRDTNREVTFATGCLMLLSRNTIEKTGLLSEDYFLYCEDTDYCFRILNKGFRIYYAKDALIYHKVSRSTGVYSKNTQYYMLRNQLMLIKYYANKKFPAYMKQMRRVLKDILKKRKNILPLFWAIFDFITGKKGKHFHKFG